MSHTTSADARTELSTADAAADALVEGATVHVQYESVHGSRGNQQTTAGEIVRRHDTLAPATDDGFLCTDLDVDTEGDGEADTRIGIHATPTGRVRGTVKTRRRSHDTRAHGTVTSRTSHWTKISKTVNTVNHVEDEEDEEDEPAIAPAEDRHGEPIEDGDVVRIKYDGEFTHGVVSAVAGQYHTGRSEGARRINIQLPTDVDNASGWTTKADERVTVVGTHEPVSGGYGLLVDEAELLQDSDLHSEAAKEDARDEDDDDDDDAPEIATDGGEDDDTTPADLSEGDRVEVTYEGSFRGREQTVEGEVVDNPYTHRVPVAEGGADVRAVTDDGKPHIVRLQPDGSAVGLHGATRRHDTRHGPVVSITITEPADADAEPADGDDDDDSEDADDDARDLPADVDADDATEGIDIRGGDVDDLPDDVIVFLARVAHYTDDFDSVRVSHGVVYVAGRTSLWNPNIETYANQLGGDLERERTGRYTEWSVVFHPSAEPADADAEPTQDDAEPTPAHADGRTWRDNGDPTP